MRPQLAAARAATWRAALFNLAVATVVVGAVTAAAPAGAGWAVLAAVLVTSLALAAWPARDTASGQAVT